MEVPTAFIVGDGGSGFNSTDADPACVDTQPFASCTLAEYVPALSAVICGVDSPVLQDTE